MSNLNGVFFLVCVDFIPVPIDVNILFSLFSTKGLLLNWSINII